MKIYTTLLALGTLAAAQVNWDDWRAPTTGDLRGPCPALNSLANHGLLPRDGRNITQSTLLHATSAINLTPELATLLFLAGLQTSSTPTSPPSFTLQDLKTHNLIEHDGSLSRADTGTPDANDQAFNPAVYAQFKSFFDGATNVSLPLAAAARWGRVQAARNTNPRFSYGVVQRFNSYAETAVYLLLLGDEGTGSVPVPFLDDFFGEERLPVREGWRPVTSINGLGTAGVILRLSMATEEKEGDLVGPVVGERGFSHGGMEL